MPASSGLDDFRHGRAARRGGGLPRPPRRRGDLGQDQHAGDGRRLPDLQRPLRDHQQSLGPGPHLRRLLRRRGGGAGDADHRAGDRLGHRRLAAHAGLVLRRLFAQADLGRWSRRSATCRRGPAPWPSATSTWSARWPARRATCACCSRCWKAARWRPAPRRRRSCKALRIGLWLNQPEFVLDPEVKAVLEAFAEELRREGAEVTRDRQPGRGRRAARPPTAPCWPACWPQDMPAAQLARCSACAAAAGLALKLGAGPDSWAALARDYTASHLDWMAADEARARAGAQVRGVFNRFDVILAPIDPVAAFPHDHRPFQRRTLTLSDGTKVALPGHAALDRAGHRLRPARHRHPGRAHAGRPAGRRAADRPARRRLRAPSPSPRRSRSGWAASRRRRVAHRSRASAAPLELMPAPAP